MLAQLAVLHGTDTGRLALLFDAMPPQVLREAMLVIVSTRPVSLTEEAEKSHRLHGAAGRGLASRVMLLDAANGDLDGLIQFNGQPRQNAAGGAPKPLDVGPDGAIQGPGAGRTRRTTPVVGSIPTAARGVSHEVREPLPDQLLRHADPGDADPDHRLGQDNPLSPLLPMAVAAAGLVAFLTVDRDPEARPQPASGTVPGHRLDRPELRRVLVR